VAIFNEHMLSVHKIMHYMFTYEHFQLSTFNFKKSAF